MTININLRITKIKRGHKKGRCPPVKPRFRAIQIIFNDQKTQGLIMTQTYTDVAAKGKTATVVFGATTDAAGNAVDVLAGSTKYASTNTDVATVTENPAGGVDVLFTGKNGSTDVTISANADTTAGGPDDEITGLISFVISTTEATGFADPTVSDLH